MISDTVEDMTRSLTTIADGARDNANMNISLPKTFSERVYKCDKLKVSETEARAAEAKYTFKHDFCPRRFKSERNMQIRRYSCNYNYNTAQEIFDVEQVVGALVHGHVDNRWLLVKWKGHHDPEWERQHLLERDGCHEVVREFWAQSGLNPCVQYIQDVKDKHRCVV